MLIKSDFISTDEDPGLRIESFAIIKLRGVSTKLNIIFFHHANFQEINKPLVCYAKKRSMSLGVPNATGRYI